MNRREFLHLIPKVGAMGAAALGGWDLLRLVGATEEWYAEAAALPQNYLLSNGTLAVDTSTGTTGIDAQATQTGDAVWAVDEITDESFLWPKNPATPSKIIRVRVTTPGTVSSSYYVQWATSLVPNNTNNINIILRADNLNSEVHNAVFFVAEDATFAKYYQWNISISPSLRESRWWPQTFPMSSRDSTGGSPVGTNTHTRMRFRLFSNAGTSPTFYICPVYVNTVAKPQVVITLDDAHPTDYTTAFPYMHARGIVGSCAIDLTSTSMTVAAMLEMQAAGWSMHNHTATHANLSLLGAAAIRTEVETCRDYLRANGLDSGRSVMVLPFGARNATVDSVVAEYYPYAASTLEGTSGFPIWPGILEPRRIERISIDVPVTSSTIIGYINAAVARGNSIILYGHNVTTSAISGNTDVDTFKPIIDHVYRLHAGGVVGNPNLEDLFTQRTNPRRRRAA